MSNQITISFKWTPEEYRRFEHTLRLASELSRDSVKSRATFRKQLVICAVMCVVFAAALVALAEVPGMGDPAQIYSLAIGFVTAFMVPFAWAVYRRRTTVSFMSIWAGVSCSFVGPMATSYVPLGSAWPYYLGFMMFLLTPPVGWWAWRKWMSLKTQRQFCESPEARWEVDDSGPMLCLDGGGRTTWKDVENVVRTGGGFLLCLQAGQMSNKKIGGSRTMFLWFPINAFAAASEMEWFASLVQTKVQRYETVG